MRLAPRTTLGVVRLIRGLATTLIFIGAVLSILSPSDGLGLFALGALLFIGINGYARGVGRLPAAESDRILSQGTDMRFSEYPWFVQVIVIGAGITMAVFTAFLVLRDLR